jgi:hypothetical protein
MAVQVQKLKTAVATDVITQRLGALATATRATSIPANTFEAVLKDSQLRSTFHLIIFT